MEIEETLYGDVLFLVNFSMDYLTIFVTAKLLHRKIRPLRLALAAVLGGIYGVASCFMGGVLIMKIVIDVAVSLLMCYISFGEKLLSCCAVFYTIGCLLGGAMTALYGMVNEISASRTVFVNGSYRTLSGDIPLGWMAVVAAIAGAAAVLGGRISERRKTVVTVIITVGEITSKVSGICDSGNLLTDTVSGSPVIVLTKDAMCRAVNGEIRQFFEDGCITDLAMLSPEAASKIRLIPALTVNGEGMLMGIRPDSVIVGGAEKDAVIASGDKYGKFGGHDALVPSVLI